VGVCPDAPPAEAPEQPRRGGLPIPIPGAIGRLEDAASAIGRLSGGSEPVPEAGPTGLLWVLKRPLAG
jgi:hypothetical protein